MMKTVKILILLSLIFNSLSAGKEVDLYNMQISNYIGIVANKVGKNIILNDDVDGYIDFSIQKNLEVEDLYPLLLSILKVKNYTLFENDLGQLEITAIDKEKAKEIAKLKTDEDKIEDNKNYLLVKVIELKPEQITKISTKISHFVTRDGSFIVDRERNLIIIYDYTEHLKTLERFIESAQNENERVIEFINLKYAKTSDVIKNIEKLSTLLLKGESIKIIPDDIKNSLVLVSSRKNINIIKPYIKRFDVVNRVTAKKTKVFSLKFLNHKRAFEILNEIFANNKNIKITSDSYSNSIIVFASEKEVNDIGNILSNLDVQKKQVYIKIKILEINENRWQKFKKKNDLITDPLLSGNEFVNLNFLLTDKIFKEIPLNKFKNLKNLISNKNIEHQEINSSNADLATPPQNYMLASTFALLNLAKALNIISEPTILSISNEDISINIDETSNSAFFKNIGIDLKMTPIVLNNDRVKLQIAIKLKNSNNEEEKMVKRDIETNVVLGNAESLIMNGLKNNFKENNFFDSDDRANLMLVLTPYIIDKNISITEFEEKLAKLNRLENQYVQDIKKLINAIQEQK